MKSLSPKVLESIYFKGVLPSVTYGICVCGNCFISIFQDLENSHMRAARIIHKSQGTG